MSVTPTARCRPTSVRCWPTARWPTSVVPRAPHLASPLSAVQLEAPIAQPPTFLAIGLNYADHVAESGMDEAEGAGGVQQADHLCRRPGRRHRGTHRGARSGSTTKASSASSSAPVAETCRVDDAPSVVAGYLIVNDVSVRDWQRATPTMTMGKSWDTHGPIGPWLVSADEVGDPHDLSIRTWVDGDLRQDATTKQMITNCWELIAHLSTAFTLAAGHHHRHRHACRSRVRHGSAAVPQRRFDRADRDRQARVPREPGHRPALTTLARATNLNGEDRVDNDGRNRKRRRRTRSRVDPRVARARRADCARPSPTSGQHRCAAQVGGAEDHPGDDATVATRSGSAAIST